MLDPRVVLPGSRKEPLAGAEPLGPADPSAVAQVTVILRRANEPLPITGFGVVADRDRYIADHGANPKDLAEIRSFAKTYGLKVLNEDVAARTVELSGKVEALSRAFGVTLRKVRSNGQIYRVREGEITIPKDLAGKVQAVLGLDNRRAAEPRFRRIAPSRLRDSDRAAAISPLEAARLYDFPAHLDGKGQGIAIIELEGGLLASDLVQAFKALNLPVPTTRIVLLDGQTNTINRHLPAHPELNADEEVALDVQIAGAIAPRAAQTIYFAQNTDQSFLKAVNVATFARPRPAAISISWGMPEDRLADQFKVSFEQALQDAANLGITVCVASGDNGSLRDSGSTTVEFPASAPHALACGGSRLSRSARAQTAETVWNSITEDRQGRSMRIGTGGGVSSFFNKPIYQASIKVPKRAHDSGDGRGVPDVCGNADPLTGYTIRVKGREVILGGTSAVAPLWAGLIARLAQGLKRPVGFLHPKLYEAGFSRSAFRNVTGGGDGSAVGNGTLGRSVLYEASHGWDACTGLGSPKGNALLETLAGSKPARSPITARPPSKARPQPTKKSPPVSVKAPQRSATPVAAAGPKPAPSKSRHEAKPVPPRPPLLQNLRSGPQSSRPVLQGLRPLPPGLPGQAGLSHRPVAPAPTPRPLPPQVVAGRGPLRPAPPVLLLRPKAAARVAILAGYTLGARSPAGRPQPSGGAAISSIAGLVSIMGMVAVAGVAATVALAEERT